MIETVLTSVLSSGALAGALIFLSKDWISQRIKSSIQHEYDQKLETHKAQLKSQSEIEIVRLKSELEVIAAEKNFRFSHVFDKTAGVIVSMYQKLVELRDFVDTNIMFFEGMDDEKKKELANISSAKWIEFETFFKQNKIYIPKHTAGEIRKFTMALSEYEHKYKKLVMLEKSDISQPSLLDHYVKQTEKLMYDLPALLTALEDDFQNLLGFPIEEQKPAAKLNK